MKTQSAEKADGIALIIVMIVITMLSILAGGFAYSMKVETKLARNATFDTEMEWLGRSGIELARYVIGQQRNIPNEPYDSLNQKWAGGPLPTNGLLSDIFLDNVPIGNGSVTVKITDAERKFNINTADTFILDTAMSLIGLDVSDSGPIVSSIQDWREPGNQPRPNGAKDDYYLSLEPPFEAKKGPITDIEELLSIRGVTPEIYLGPRYSGPLDFKARLRRQTNLRLQKNQEQQVYAVGMADLFSALGSPFLNLNTASQMSLQVVPGLDENMAAAIIQRRAGPDGVDGTVDDMPFRSPMELMTVPGMDPRIVGQIARYFSTQSTTFNVEVTVQLDQRKRVFTAILRRLDQKNLPVLTMYWK
jgi:type II secretory pathway component PulK